MAAYYNEIEPYAAEWLRNLIKAGHIADGEVDTRSIELVEPDDLRRFTQCHFFAGIAGWSHALRLAGWADERPIWTGSCPCQPFSVAGKGAGTDDPRHLWPHFFRLIRACRPPVVMGEQVAGKAGYGWLDGVRADLEAEGYACEGVDIPACAVNAPHIRQRLYWVARDMADSGHDKSEKREGNECKREQWPPQRRGEFLSSWSGAGSRNTQRDYAERDDRYNFAAKDRSNDDIDMANASNYGAGRIAGQASDSGRGAVDTGAEGLRCADGARGAGWADARNTSGDMADAKSIGRRGRPHDEDEWRREQPFADPCEGGGSMADADNGTGLKRGFELRWQEASGEPCIGSEDDVVNAPGFGRGEGRPEHEVWIRRPAIAGAGGSDMADADDAGRQGWQLLPERAGECSAWSDGVEWRRGADGKTRRVKSGIRLLAHGVPARVGRLRAYGNAIVPPLAAEVIRAFMESK